MPSEVGVVNGSSSVGYAAVFGRLPSGSSVIHLAQTSPWWSAVACWAKKIILKPRLKMSGLPPAGSTYSMRLRSATADAGRLSSEEKVPSSRSTLSLLISAL